MNSLIIDFAKNVKAEIKNTPETFRVWFGAISRIFMKINLLPLGEEIKFDLKDYDNGVFGKSIVVSPDNMHCMTTFFDVDPFSPDGKRICVTRLPFINRIPIPGDIAQVCIIDITNSTIKAVYNTKGWGAQLGANVQWIDDNTVVCNEETNGIGHGVKIKLNDLNVTKLDGPIYGLTPCKNFSYSGNLTLVNRILPGYGIPDPLFGKTRQRIKNSKTEGLWKTDINTGSSKLFMSIDEILCKLDKNNIFRKGYSHVFNVKVSPDGSKLFVVMFCVGVPKRFGRVLQLITIDIQTEEAYITIPDDVWRKGGHHPNWLSDSTRILVNLKYSKKEMQFITIDYLGNEYKVLAEGIRGGGHPSLDFTNRYILTDSYISEGFTDADGHVPIRIIDTVRAKEHTLTKVFTNKLDGPRRVDPHPVWAKDGKHIAFNAVVNNYRSIIISEFKANNE